MITVFLFACKSMTCNTTINMVRWDQTSVEIEILDEDNNPIDITTMVIYFTARLASTVDDTDDTTAKIAKVINPPHIDPVNWITSFDLTSSDLDTVWSYLWDIQVVDWSNKVSSFYGELNIVQDITKA